MSQQNEHKLDITRGGDAGGEVPVVVEDSKDGDGTAVDGTAVDGGVVDADADDGPDAAVLWPEELPESPVFKGVYDGDVAALHHADGFDEEEVVRGLGDSVQLAPARFEADPFADLAPPPVVDTPVPTITLDSVVESGYLDALEVPAVPEKPFFLNKQHFVTPCPRKAIAAIAQVLSEGRCSCDAKFKEEACKFSAVKYSSADHVEYCVYVYHRPETGDAVVEFNREFGCRATWSDTYSMLINRLFELGIAPKPAPVARPCSLYAPLPPLDDLSDLEDEDDAPEPSSAPSACAKAASALGRDLDCEDVPAILKTCEDAVKSADCVDDVADLVDNKEAVKGLVSIASSFKPGQARVALLILAEIASLVSSDQGDDGVDRVFGNLIGDIAKALKTVFRDGNLSNFRYAELYRFALKLVCNLAISENVVQAFADREVDSLIKTLCESSTCCKKLGEQASVAFSSVCES